MPTPSANRQLLERLFASDKIQLRHGDLFDQAPPPLPPGLDFGRIEGMLLGIAVGDALGSPSEGARAYPTRRARYPEPLDYIGGRGHPTDDTQLSFWFVEQLLRDGGFVPENVARLYAERGHEIVGIGGVVSKFRARAAEDWPWEDWAPSGQDAMGNGALMRIAPVVLPHLRGRTADLWADAALAGRLTHDSSVSTASCVALVHLIWECLRRDRSPDPGWWVQEFVRVARPLDDMPYFPPLRHPPARLAGFRGTHCDLIEQHVWRAWMDGWTVRQACDPYGRGWGSGPFLFETVPSVLYVLMRHGNDFEAAVAHAVLDTRDNDSIAAIVGAVLGALHGKEAIPERWVRGLSGRTRGAGVEDDRQVFRLIEQARAAFAP